MRKINRLIVHHSASPLSTTVEDIRRWHVEDNGWSDIGYHYIILQDGTIEDGRPIHKIGAHAKGKNRYSIGVCVVGNFENIHATPQQFKSLLCLINDLCTTYGFGWDAVSAHRDWSNTKCCGKNLYSLLIQMKRQRSGLS